MYMSIFVFNGTVLGHFVAQILTSLLEGLHFFDAFLRVYTFSTHFSKKTLFRRISLSLHFFDAFLRRLHFFDAFLQVYTFSTHFAKKLKEKIETLRISVKQPPRKTIEVFTNRNLVQTL